MLVPFILPHPQAPHSFPHSYRTLRSEQTGERFPNTLSVYCADAGLSHISSYLGPFLGSILGPQNILRISINFYIDLKDVALDIGPNSTTI